MNNFLQLVRTNASIYLYEDKNVLEKAKSQVPVEIQERVLISKKNCGADDISVLTDLAVWFKTNFFKWFDKPTCEVCGNVMDLAFISMDVKTGTRIENFRCRTCGTISSFPRYNDPSILLKTRMGRCGEWANCFTLLCVALGYDARYVIDSSDHVWTEVYLPFESRWVHCDSGECSIDNPLMYEIGWKKSLSYVIAYSNKDVQDVTWRYVRNFEKTLANRKLCSEQDLTRTILELNEQRQKRYPSLRGYLTTRMLSELVSFLKEPEGRAGSYGGRQSGSKEWRINRGEYTEENVQHHAIVWRPKGAEFINNRFVLRYSTALNKYHRAEVDEYVDGFKNGIYNCCLVFRKVEHDWKMVYLCREENESKGSICWKFEIDNADVVIDTVKLVHDFTLFENGKVTCKMYNDTVSIQINEKVTEISDFKGSNVINIYFELDGGTGREAWQHAQLLRQSMMSNDYPFELTITFGDSASAKSALDH